MHFPLSSNRNGNGCFSDVSSEKTYNLLCFCIILGDIEIFINLSIFNFINFIGKGGAFHGLLYIYIIRVALNTGFDTTCLSGWHTQMTHFGVYHLVCPFSIWPRQGFYVDLFLIDAFPSE